METHPECQLIEVAMMPPHVYLLVRLSTGRLLRIHAKDELS